MYALARHEEGITINGLEFVLDDFCGDVMQFKTVEDAKTFIVGKGLDPKDFGYSVFAYDLQKNEVERLK